MLDINHDKVDFDKVGIPAGKDKKTGKQLYKRHPMFEVVSHLFLVVHMESITDKNWREFYLRAKIAERAYGPFMRDGKGEDKLLEPGHIRDYIGLRANVSPKSKVQFRTLIDHNLRAEFGRGLARWEEENADVINQLAESVHRPVSATGS